LIERARKQEAMFSEDYIKRLIKVASDAMLEAIGFKTVGRYQEALDVLDQMLEQVVGMKAGLIHRLDDASLLAALTNEQDELDLDRLLVVSDLVKAEGDIHAEQGKSQTAYWSYLRAFNLYLEVVLNMDAQDVSEPVDKLEELLPLVQDADLPAETLFAWYAYDERVGNYARGAHVLERMAQIPGLWSEMQEELRAYYQRLLEKSNSELENGGLSKAQVNQRLVDLR
jgi:tetratricopeptide (TPR) repeat protein